MKEKTELLELQEKLPTKSGSGQKILGKERMKKGPLLSHPDKKEKGGDYFLSYL